VRAHRFPLVVLGLAAVLRDGQVVAQKGLKNVVTVTWKYSFGEQSVAGFKEAFEKGGGKVVKDMTLPFPNVEFQPFLTEIASLKPDAVFVFFAGAGAAKFVKDYAAAGLKSKHPALRPGLPHRRQPRCDGWRRRGLLTTLHYADGLDNAKDGLPPSYVATYKAQPDVYAVQGYDAAQMYEAGLKAAGGDARKEDTVIKGMEAATIDSPRGAFTCPRRTTRCRTSTCAKVQGGQNKVVGRASRARRSGPRLQDVSRRAERGKCRAQPPATRQLARVPHPVLLEPCLPAGARLPEGDSHGFRKLPDPDAELAAVRFAPLSWWQAA
jgi:hypothetical protein